MMEVAVAGSSCGSGQGRSHTGKSSLRYLPLRSAVPFYLIHAWAG